MGNRRSSFLAIVLAMGLIGPTLFAGQKKDPLIADNYTLIPGNGTTIADTLAGEENVYLGFAAKNSDGTVNAVIEIPAGTNDQWATDVATGRLFRELKNGAPRTISYIAYPCNYGIVPRTRGSHGDPLDIIVMGGMLLRGATVSVKVIGVMQLVDNGESNNILIAVIPGSFMGGINTLLEFNAQYPGIMSIITTWFTNYKGPGGGLSSGGFGDADTASAILNAAVIDTSLPVVPAVYAERADDSLLVDGYTRTPGNYGMLNGVLGSCDTLTGDKDVYRDFSPVTGDGTVNAVIEIPSGTNSKWETDVNTGKFFWENKNGVPRVIKFLGYPVDYGMIPRTVGGDGDPLDIIVLGGILERGSVVPVKLIGVMFLVDQGLIDDKLIAVLPGSGMDSISSMVKLNARCPGARSIIETWLTNYKGIAGGLSSNGFGDVDTAAVILDSAINRFGTPVLKRDVGNPGQFGFRLSPPNRGTTNAKIEFSLPRAEWVTLNIYNLSGNKIAALADSRYNVGVHSFLWDTRNIPAGCYFLRLQAGPNARVKNIVLFR